MAVSKRVRYEVLRRDNHACRYCGGVAPDVVLTIDHVHPVALGGGDGPENLVAACRDCNAGKTSTTPDGPLVADVAQDALRWSKAMEAVVEIRRHRQWEIDVSVARFVELWNDWKYPDGTTTELPGDWESSVRRFLIAGLDADRDMKEFIRQTMGFTNARDPFAMFCKKCWDEINDRQRETQAALAALPTDDDDEDEGVRFVTLPEVAGRIIACLPDWDIEDLDRWYAMSIDDPSGYFHSGMRYGFDFIRRP